MEKVTLEEALEWVGEYSKPERFADIRQHLLNVNYKHPKASITSPHSSSG